MSAAVTTGLSAVVPATILGKGIEMSVLSKTHARDRGDEILFRVIYLSTLPVFLLAMVVRRLMPGRRVARLGGNLTGLSIAREAKAAARTCGSLALMG